MQGIYINYTRPKSKKAVKEAIASAPETVEIEATSIFGNEYDGPVTGLAEGQTISFVCPDPYTSRKFFGTIRRTAKGLVVS